MSPGSRVRASSLPYLCPREEVLAYRYDVIREEHLAPTLQITFDIGHYYHDLYRDVYYGPMQEWAGAWECLHCKWDTDKAGLSVPPEFKKSPGKLAKMPEKCGGCGAPFYLPPDADERAYGTFKEWLIFDPVLCLEGHPDGWSWRPGMERILTDLKSHTHNGFSSRNKPMDGHEMQVWAYEHMCGDEIGELWYMNKSPWGSPSSFVRAVRVPFDVKGFEMFVQRPLVQIQEGLAGGPLPERGCIDPGVPGAKQCQLSDVCFEG